MPSENISSIKIKKMTQKMTHSKTQKMTQFKPKLKNFEVNLAFDPLGRAKISEKWSNCTTK